MYEGLNHWGFVIASYAIGLGGTLLLVGQSLRAMRQAEARRDKARER